ncbi:TPA: hypothetical protein ACX6RV_003991 [Photobacterium damselae]
MQLSKTFLATSIISIFTLSGCGGGDNDNKLPIVDNATKTIKVIDGYLSDAEICVDINANTVCEKSEIIGHTKSDGSFQLTKTQSNYPIIANIISGKTKDSDIDGLAVLQSYSMYALESDIVVTPFTTLAKIKNISISDLASELELPEDVISGDYIALKKHNSDGIKAHYIARALAAAKMPMDVSTINEIINESKRRILHSINNNTLDELDNKLLIINDDGKFIEQVQIKDLEQHLVKKDNWHNGSLNSQLLSNDGIQKVSFKDGLMHFYHDTGTIEESIKYKLENNKLYAMIDNQKDESDEFVYASEKLLLSVADGIGDLIFWTEDDLSDSFNASNMTLEMFKGKTWYYLADDSTDSNPSFALIQLIFSNDNDQTVIIKEGNETQKGAWSIVSVTDGLGTHTNLNIDLKDSSDPMSLALVTNANDLLLTSEISNKNQYSLLTKNEDLAEGLYDIVSMNEPDIEIPPENKVCKNPILWDGPISFESKLEAGRNKVISFNEIPNTGLPNYYLVYHYGINSDDLGFDFDDLPNGKEIIYTGEKKEAVIGVNASLSYSKLFEDPLEYTFKFTLPNGDIIEERVITSINGDMPSLYFKITNCDGSGYYDFEIRDYKE